MLAADTEVAAAALEPHPLSPERMGPTTRGRLFRRPRPPWPKGETIPRTRHPLAEVAEQHFGATVRHGDDRIDF
jgi:hypothetical protein